MAPKFGTSGLRGLVTELSDALIADYTRAFLSACAVEDEVFLGHDLRGSSPDMAKVIAQEVVQSGRTCVDCGALPTPALALAATGAAAIMVTGSHIPADRNGLKFYTSAGEITKAEEQAITAARGADAPAPASPGTLRPDTGAGERFVARYVTAFGPKALSGRRIGLYAHSAVGRDLLAACLAGLGAEVVELARSETFIPVDT